MCKKEARVLIRIGGILFLLFVCCSSIAQADIQTDTMRGKELLYQRNYPAALEIFRQIEQNYPDCTAGLFGQMAAYQIMMYENLDYRWKDEYEEVEDRFERRADKNTRNDPSSWNLFITGAAYGMRGFYYMRDDRWFRALGSAVKGIRLMKRVIYNDPTFVDARLGPGMYDFWRTVYTKEITSLPFFPDRRKEGLAAVKEVMEHGLYGRDLAETNLAYMLAQNKQYKESREITDRYLAKYPENIILRQLSARLYFSEREYKKAIEEYERILKQDPSMTKSLYYIGYAYMRMPGGQLLARKYLNDFLATNPEKHWAKYARKNLEKLP